MSFRKENKFRLTVSDMKLLKSELIFHTKVTLPTFRFLLLKLAYRMPAQG